MARTVPPEVAQFEGRPIRRVVLRRPVTPAPAAASPAAGEPPAPPTPPTPGGGEFQELDNEVRTLAEVQIRSTPGRPYQHAVAQDDVRRLNRLGRFKTVESRVEPQDDGSVVLYFTLTPQPIVREVLVVGNERISDQDIFRQVEILVGTPVDDFQLDRASRQIEAMYRTRGYYLARVDVDRPLLEQTGQVIFRVREGSRVRVTDVRFEGNTRFDSRLLRRDLQTRSAFLFNRGALEDEKLDRDVASLVEFYRNRGHLDVRVDRAVRPSPDGREAVVTFVIDEGPAYTMRSVRTQIATTPEGGTPVFSAEQLAGLMAIKPGDAYALDRLRRTESIIRGAYGKMGYADVRVERRELRDPALPEVDILVIIDEGRPFRAGEVIIQGNDLTRHEVIRREVEVLPDRPLDSSALEESKTRLDDLRLFRQPGPGAPGVKVTTQPPDDLEPDHRDVLVEVEESNTGSINLGAAVASDSGIVGRLSLSQRNFDITDTPETVGDLLSGNAFRGGGQRFSIDLLPGTRTQSYSVSLAEPYFLDTDYSSSGAVYYRTNVFDQYDENRLGTTLALGRRFGTRWSGQLPVRIESIDLSDVEPDAPVDVFDVSGRNALTSVGLTLTRSTLDSNFRPSRGQRFTTTVEQFGALGGDFTFTRFSAEHTIYLTLAEDFLERRTVLSFNTRLGYIPQGRDETPVYERFYLGGQSFRGFGFRAVGPLGLRNDTRQPGGDPVGGTFMFFFGPQINIPIFDDVFSIVFFSDTGTISNDVGFDDYRVTIGTGLRFYIRQLSPAPLAFDFAIPVMRQDSDRKRIFTFSVDLPF
jgi:outer membrane protein insertion porin family